MRRPSRWWTPAPLLLGVVGLALTRGELFLIAGLLGSVALWRPRLAWYGLVLVLTVELGTRISLFGVNGLRWSKLQSLQDVGIGALLEPARDPEMIWEWRPHLDRELEFVPFRTNSHGMVDDELPLAKPDDTWRVGVLGASFTLPQGVAHEDAFHTLVEDELAGRSPRVELLNFSTAAMDLRQAVAHARHKAVPFDLDALVVCFPLSGLREEWRYSEPYEPPLPDQAFFSSFFIRFAFGPLTDLRELWDPKSDDDVGLRPSAALVGDLAQIAKEHDVRVAIVVLIRMVSYDRAEIERAAAQHGIPVIAVGEEFAGDGCAHPSGLCTPDIIYPLNAHPGPLTQAVLAEQLTPALLREGLLPRSP